jgi:hypothetical protein
MDRFNEMNAEVAGLAGANVSVHSGLTAAACLPALSQSGLYKVRTLAPEPDDAIASALATDAVARRILAKGLAPAPGELVGVRLNINVLKSTGVAVHSVHRATSKDGHRAGRGFYRGEVITYLPVVMLRDAYFNVHQGGREGIASGRMSKHPMASIDGTFVAQQRPLVFDGVAIGFNPKKSHLFTDEEGYAVQYAEEVTILANRAYGRGRLAYFDERTAPMKAGDSPSLARFRK